jgi:hypothetical protein
MIKYFAKYTNSVLVSLKTCLVDYEPAPTDHVEVTSGEFNTLLGIIADLSAAKDAAKGAIDKRAGETRLKYITSVPGQAETYMMKSDEAAKIKAIGYETFTTEQIQNAYPVVFAEMSATGAGLVVVCETILGTAQAWRVIAANIERERRQAKIEVDGCSNVSEIQYAIESAYNSLASF